MTKIQEYTQADGPHRPRAEILATMLDSVPSHLEVRAISINGQTGDVVIELYHDGMDIHHEFNTPKCTKQYDEGER